MCSRVTGLELESHLPDGVALKPLVRWSPSGDVATQLLKSLAVLSFAPHDRVQNEAVDVSETGLARCSLARHRPCMPARVGAQLLALTVEFLLEELVVNSWACEIDVRRRSYELQAGELGASA